MFTVPPTHKPGAVSLFPSVDTGTEPRRGRVGWVGGRTLRGWRGTGEMVDIGVGERMDGGKKKERDREREREREGGGREKERERERGGERERRGERGRE